MYYEINYNFQNHGKIVRTFFATYIMMMTQGSVLNHIHKWLQVSLKDTLLAAYLGSTNSKLEGELASSIWVGPGSSIEE